MRCDVMKSIYYPTPVPPDVDRRLKARAETLAWMIRAGYVEGLRRYTKFGGEQRYARVSFP